MGVNQEEKGRVVSADMFMPHFLKSSFLFRKVIKGKSKGEVVPVLFN
jgi:hypothetical protein